MLLGYSDDFHALPETAFDRAKEGKAKPLRWPVDWAGAQPAEGPFSWGAHDYVFSAARARGLTLCPILYNSPSWARPGNPNGIAPPDSSHNGSWGRFVKEFTRRYSPGTVEIWNEPNIPEFWAGESSNPARMAELFNLAYAQIRQYETAHTLILSPGLAAIGGNTSAQAQYFSQFKSGVTTGADYGAAVHLYAFRSCEEGNHVETCLKQLDAFKAVIENRRLWVTETGFSSGKSGQSGCTGARQAEEHASNWAGCVNRGVEAYIAFRLVDSESQTGTFFEHFGVVSHGYVNKPAFTKLAELA